MIGNPQQPDIQSPGLGGLTRAFALVGVISFGGAAGQIALMHRLVVDEKRWLDEKDFQAALSYCMLLPGPEAQQLATYIGWRLHGTWGALISGLLFVIPGAAVMLALSLLYWAGSASPSLLGLFFGIKCAVIAIILHALLRLARRGWTSPPLTLVGLAAFSLLSLDLLPFPAVVTGAAVIGILAGRLTPWLPHAGGTGAETAPAPFPWRPVLSAALLWLGPLAAIILWAGAQSLPAQIGIFFSKLAVVSFGGAYAVLAYLADAAVAMGWATTRQMIDGLGLAETTPGPTILVNQFIAFLAGAAQGGVALGAGLSLLAVWMTFAPSFLWIFAGAPYLGVIRRQRDAAAALAAITAAVTGVVAHVALSFTLHVLFTRIHTLQSGPLRLEWPEWQTADPAALALALAGGLLIFRWHLATPVTVGILALAGLALRLSGV